MNPNNQTSLNANIELLQDNYLIKQYFIKLANKFNSKCSLTCGLEEYENQEIFLLNKDRQYFNKNELYMCYERCILKNYQASMDSLSYLNEHMKKYY